MHGFYITDYMETDRRARCTATYLHEAIVQGEISVSVLEELQHHRHTNPAGIRMPSLTLVARMDNNQHTCGYTWPIGWSRNSCHIWPLHFCLEGVAI